ncbi:MAG: hypothetical protein AMK73_07060 [Planctomycetes bacterium SM23_32]|nr:MAG: hypothetical protein AMK73_07060 [Planctomycetes bacterium SM23_32]
MLRELTKEDWMKMLGIPQARIPQALVMWGTRALKTRYAAMRERFTQVLDVRAPNGLLEDVLIGSLGDADVAYASVYGAPMASEVVHVFGMLGTPLVIQIGTCGGFAEGLEAGGLFVPEEAYCGEGASQYYKTSGKTVAATLTFADEAESCGCRIPLTTGRMYTTSALFAESRDDIERWAQQGFAAVDMETAATFSVAEHFGMDRGALLAVFDNPRGRNHILSTESDKEASRAAAQRAMVDIALAAIESRVQTGGEQGAA